MNLDRTTIAVRERRLPELYDLALLVCRRHAGALAVLALVGCGPWILLDGWLLADGREESAGLRWWLLLLLMAAQLPLATAPIAAYLGQAMFDEHPRVATALRDGFRRWGALLLAGLYRTILALLPLLLVLWPSHLVESLVLERSTGRDAWRRAHALRSAGGGAAAMHLLIGLLLAVAALWCLAGTWQALSGILLHADPWGDQNWFDISAGPGWPAQVALWLTTVFTAVVRFLAYIDLRTRHEGWEIGLALQRAARRLDGTA